MTDSRDGKGSSGALKAFGAYLRTGRWAASSDNRIEIKFNPWHNPDDGRFTFAGSGRFFAGGSGSNDESSGGGVSGSRSHAPAPARRRESSKRSAGDFSGEQLLKELQDPRNYSIYQVRSGDNLTRIAKSRKGLSAESLAWVNGLPVDGTLRIGQKLRVPTQAYLEFNRKRFQNFLALRFYLATHGGKLPIPADATDKHREFDSANPPSISEQISAPVDAVSANGFTFARDILLRSTEIGGTIPMESRAERSRRLQAAAGGEDRRLTDEGGHFIAARLNGPPIPENHFAQDANFNRGAYRALEDKLARLRQSQKIPIHIVVTYEGLSLRPASLTVSWKENSKEETRFFRNKRGGK